MSAQAELQPTEVITETQPPAEQPAEEVQAANDETKDEATEEGQDRDEKGQFKPRHKVQERIDELTRKAGEKEREAAYWRGVAEAAKPKAEPEAPKEAPGKPKADAYASYDEYIDALTDWKIEQRDQTREARQKAEAQAATWQSRATEAKATLTDFDEVLQNSTAPMNQAMADVIRESEHGPVLAYHLAKNPAEAGRIAQLSPLAAARELGRLEATLSAPKPKPAQRVTSAPTPPTTVGNGRSTEGDPATMSMADYMAWRKGALQESR